MPESWDKKLILITKKLEIMIHNISYILLILSVIGVLANTYWMVNESPIYYGGIKIWGVVFVITLIFLLF